MKKKEMKKKNNNGYKNNNVKKTVLKKKSKDYDKQRNSKHKVSIDLGNIDINDDVKIKKNFKKKVSFKEDTIPTDVNSGNEELANEIRIKNLKESKDNDGEEDNCKCKNCYIF